MLSPAEEFVSIYLQWVHKLVFLEKPVLELGRLAARPCMVLVCANGKRHLTSADPVTLGGWWDTTERTELCLVSFGSHS